MKLLQWLLLLLVSNQVYAAGNVWFDQGENAARAAEATLSGRHFTADVVTLRQQLDMAPHENSGDRSQVIYLPMPDGSTSRFSVVESPIMHADMAAQYPQIKTFRVSGVDDESALGRIDIGPRGFRGMLFTSQGRVFIDPTRADGLTSSYVSGFARRSSGGSQFSCGVNHMMDRSPLAEFVELRARTALAREENRLLRYDLAVSATEEYARAVDPDGPDISDVTSEIVTAISRVNVFYERDLGIRLILVSNTGSLIEPQGGTQFTNDDPFEMLEENAQWLSGVNHDIGHVFSTQGGGLAFIGGVCIDQNKSKGVTGLSNPTGDRFYVDYVAHEIGHQLGAEHTFNGTSVSCGGVNRVDGSAVEPGSGSTIMGYAGICGVEDLQDRSDATFHALSMQQIEQVVNSSGSCFTTTAAIGNADPNVTAIGNRTIPRETAFYLDATGSDGDNDTLSYQWDQMDSGKATNAVTFGQDFGNNALFRTYEPRMETARQFPSVDTQVRGLVDDAEVLPCQDRELNFRVTVRDGASGQASDDVTLTVDKDSGPFRITNFDSEQTILSNTGPVNLRWDVAGTNLAPVACSQVDIDLLAFAPGYVTYSEFRLLTTANDGEALVQISPITDNADRARFRVSCRNNYFYDISDADLEIIGTGSGNFANNEIKSYANVGGTRGTVAQICPDPASTSDGDDGGGGGSFDWWLPLFALLGLLRRQFRFCSEF